MSKKSRGAVLIAAGVALGLVAVPIAWGLGAVVAPFLVVGGVALRRPPELRGV